MHFVQKGMDTTMKLFIANMFLVFYRLRFFRDFVGFEYEKDKVKIFRIERKYVNHKFQVIEPLKTLPVT